MESRWSGGEGKPVISPGSLSVPNRLLQKKDCSPRSLFSPPSSGNISVFTLILPSVNPPWLWHCLFFHPITLFCSLVFILFWSTLKSVFSPPSHHESPLSLFPYSCISLHTHFFLPLSPSLSFCLDF